MIPKKWRKLGAGYSARLYIAALLRKRKKPAIEVADDRR
jgi:hypothetical protein